MDIDRAHFPKRTQLQGMSAQADQWFLLQIEKNDMTISEALYITHRLVGTVIDLMRRQEEEEEEETP